MPVYRYESVLDATPEDVFAWHERPGAFERLSPTWADVRVLEREGGIRDGARVVVQVHKGPVHVTGELRALGVRARAASSRTSRCGGRWELTSTRTASRLPTSGQCLVQDEVEWEAPVRPAAEIFTQPLIQRELSRLFPFRHERLAHDFDLHGRFADRPRLTVAISGRHRLHRLGAARLPHVSGGHRVRPDGPQEGKRR